MASFIPHTPEETGEMLTRIGLKSIEDLLLQFPATNPRPGAPDLSLLGEGMDERALLRWFAGLAEKNKDASRAVVFRGAGSYDHFIPSATGALVSRGEFLTSYTPYQPEASQGLLQAIFEFQTAISRLYGMDLSNASLYDGATALAEAVLVAIRETGRSRILLSEGLDPMIREVVHTYLEGLSIKIDLLPLGQGGQSTPESLKERVDESLACFVGAIPTFFGTIDDFNGVADLLHGVGALFLLHANPHALALLRTPGEWGADIATGEGQSLGLPLSSGGPYLGLMTARKKYVRRIPGRLAGLTKDSEGRPCFVLTLQAREQHIRREKANSNICSNETLLGIAALVNMALLGPGGLARAAAGSWKNAHDLEKRLTALPGVRNLFPNAPFFHEFVLEMTPSAKRMSQFLLERGILGGLPLEPILGSSWSGRSLWCATEVRTEEEISQAVDLVREFLRQH